MATRLQGEMASGKYSHGVYQFTRILHVFGVVKTRWWFHLFVYVYPYLGK